MEFACHHNEYNNTSNCKPYSEIQFFKETLKTIIDFFPELNCQALSIKSKHLLFFNIFRVVENIFRVFRVFGFLHTNIILEKIVFILNRPNVLIK